MMNLHIISLFLGVLLLGVNATYAINQKLHFNTFVCGWLSAWLLFSVIPNLAKALG